MVKKILLVFGTRPEAIKMAPLVKELQRHDASFDIKVCVTGQHREMLDQVLDIFEITPDYDLNIMKSGQDLYDITSKVLLGMRDVLSACTPDMVLVHGDTTTSTAAALASFYQQIAVGHVEAGLRTGDIRNPWPEEMNRQITGRIASIHFSPTTLGKQNLLNENIPSSRIHVTGNTVIDALHYVTNRITQSSELLSELNTSLIEKGYNPYRNNRKVLITGHRRENFGNGFIGICNGIKNLALKYPNLDFIYPMHLNPNVRRPIKEVFYENNHSLLKNVFFIEPLDYLNFVNLMHQSDIVLTDSGGIQEEAPGLGKPVLVMRTTTERPEAVDAGTVKLVGTDSDTIFREVSLLLDSPEHYTRMSKAVNPYGDGMASARIADILSQYQTT